MKIRTVWSLILVSLGVLLLPLLLVGQEYTITDSFFLPPVYYVGDQVEVRLVVRSAFATAMTVPEELPQPTWGLIRDARIIERGIDREVRVRFVPFETGTKSFPALNLGPLVIDDITIFVSSILDPDQDQGEIASLRGQILIPGTQAFIVSILAGLFFVPVFGILGFRVARVGWVRLRVFYAEGRPYRRYLRSLRSLRNSADVLGGRDFYISLLFHIREYFRQRFGVAAQSLTTKELAYIFDHYITEAADREQIIQLFHHGDRVKFANLSSTITSRMAHLERAEKVIHNLEIKERRDAELKKSKQKRIKKQPTEDRHRVRI
ncbi:MAG: hypothetical protein GW949_01580 [Spirochaetales bacterium]|nr:hypothetical protein [Spirochaetales bacterium]